MKCDPQLYPKQFSCTEFNVKITQHLKIVLYRLFEITISTYLYNKDKNAIKYIIDTENIKLLESSVQLLWSQYIKRNTFKILLMSYQGTLYYARLLLLFQMFEYFQS